MKNNESVKREYTIIDILYYIFKIKWIILMLTVVCGIAGYLYSVASYKPLYTATASMVVNIKNRPYADQNGNISQASPSEIMLAQTLVDTYAIILKSKKVAQSVIDDLKLDLTPAKVGSYISLSSAKDTQIMYVNVKCSSPQLAMDIANSLMKVAPEAMMDTVETGTVNVLDRALLPKYTEPRNSRYAAMIGAGSGLGIGILIALIMGIYFSKVGRRRDVEERLELPVLGEIPHIKKKGRFYEQMLINSGRNSHYTQAIMKFSNVVQFNASQQNMKTIILASAIGGEGKTTIAVNMAIAFAKMDKTVLLIDADFRKPSIGRIFGITPANSLGVMPLIKTNANIYNCIVKHHSGIHILPGFESYRDPIDSTFSERFSQFLSSMKNYYDYVILDTAPAYLVSDTALLSKYADGIILVARQEHSSIKVISDTLLELRKGGAKVMGCVLNDLKLPRLSRRANTYTYTAYTGTGPEEKNIQFMHLRD